MEKSVKGLTLKEVKLAFAQWRANKTGLHVPQTLWDQVNSLKQFYAPTLIRKTLSISGSQYKKHILSPQSDETFVEIPFKQHSITNTVLNSKLSTNNLMEIDIFRSDGARLSIKELDIESVSALIQEFLG